MGAPDPIADAPPTPAQTAIVEFRCDNCGAPTKSQAGADALVCEHCGHRQAIERKEGRIVEYDFQAALRDAPRGSAADLATGAREVECKGCGARTVTTGQSGACPFCGSPLVADLKAGDKLMLPESLLPHKVTREEAKAGFQRWLRSRWFAPNDLVRRSKTAGLDGVMLPHWTYDSNTSTSYTGLRGDHYYVTVSYTDSKGNTQTRTEQRTRWSHASGTVYVTFDDVLICASRSLPADLVRELEPWDLAALQPFDPAYLAGYVTERYQIDLAAGFDLADDRMRPRIRSAINRDIGGDVQQILSMNVTHHDVKFKHLLLPLWISSFRYKERVFRVMVNARTGEVQGERPWSWIKITLFVLFIAALVGTGFWLYTRSREAHDDDGYETPAPYEPPTPIEPPMPDLPPLPPPPPRPAIAPPLGELAPARAEAQKLMRDAAFAGLEIDEVTAGGDARGEAIYSFVSAKAARAHRSCMVDVMLGPDGLTAGDSDQRDDDCAPALTVPACTLAEVMARLPSELPWPPVSNPSVVYQAPALAEAPARGKPLRGEWLVGVGDATVTVADDCAPPPKPKPARRPARPR